MCECDYIISHVITGAESLVLIDGKCCEGSNRVVVDHSIKLKHRIGDQTIIDNSWVPKMKINMLKVSMAAIWNSWLEQVR